MFAHRSHLFRWWRWHFIGSLDFSAEEKMRVETNRRFRVRSSKRLVMLSAAAGVAALSSTLRADTFANNGGLDLSLSTSWIDLSIPTTDSAPPSTNDIAQWDLNSAGGTFALNAANTGTTTNWLGIKVLNPAAPIVIGGDTTDILSLGASGINMSAATQNLTISDPIVLKPLPKPGASPAVRR